MKLSIEQTQNAQVGDTYDRLRYEVQYFNKELNNWIVSVRMRTVEEAEQWIEKTKNDREALKFFIDMGKVAKMRIVKAESVCEIVKLIP